MKKIEENLSIEEIYNDNTGDITYNIWEYQRFTYAIYFYFNFIFISF